MPKGPRRNSRISGDGHSQRRNSSVKRDLSTNRLPPHSTHSREEYSSRLPMEMVELIIDAVSDGATFISCSLVCKAWLARCRYYLFSRVSTPAGSCVELLRMLDSTKMKTHIQQKPAASKNTGLALPPPGRFVQSLVVTSSAQGLLAPCPSVNPRHNPSLAASLLLESVPNVKGLQLMGVTEWALAHFLGPLSTTGNLQDLALLDVRCAGWKDVSIPLARCAPNLASLRISGLWFRHPPETINDKTDDQCANTKGVVLAQQQEVRFPLLKQLAIEHEHEDSRFAQEFLDIVSKHSLENLKALELPLGVVTKSEPFLESVGNSLEKLTIHCDGLRTGEDHSEPEVSPLNLGVLPFLNSLHLILHSHLDYGIPALVSLRILIKALTEFPYNTLTTLRLSFRTTLGFTSYTRDQWRELDDTLSLPHLATLSRLEFVGLGSVVAPVRRGLPNACSRGIIHFL